MFIIAETCPTSNSPSSKSATPYEDALARTILDALKGNPPKHTLPKHRQNRYNLRARPHSYRHQATQNLVAQLLFATPSLASAFHVYNPDSGKKESLDSLLMGPERDRWLQAASNEFGRLAQGNKYGVTATDTIDFIHQYDIPHDLHSTY